FFSELKRILLDYNIQLRELEYTNDIWCRDYMPVQINNNTFLKYRYDPDYLKSKEHIHSRTNTNEVWNWLTKHHHTCLKNNHSMLVLDGGNVVKSKDKVILTDKIFTENFNLNVSEATHVTSKQKEFIIEMIKNDMEVTDVIIVPRLSGDWLGHTDGMVRFLNENEVLVSNFDFLLNDPEISEHLKSQIRKFYSILENDHKLKIHKMPYYEYPDDKHEGHHTANGCYINYLQVKNLVILPRFGKPKEDKDALKKFKVIFKPKGIKVESVDATEVSRHQGVINCVTWNIIL
ncbi:MAG: agmatine deiminase family protein, partial [Nitrosopumilus sp.]